MMMLTTLWASAQTFTDVIEVQGATGINGKRFVWDATYEITIIGAHDVKVVKEKKISTIGDGYINGVLTDSTYVLKKKYDATVYDGTKLIVVAKYKSLTGPRHESKKNNTPLYLGANVRVSAYDDQGQSNDFNREFRMWGEDYPSVSDTLYARLDRDGYHEDSLHVEGEVYFSNSGQGELYGRISRDNPNPEFRPGIPYNTFFCVPEVEAVIKFRIYPNPNGNNDEDEEEEDEVDDDEEWLEEDNDAANWSGVDDFLIPGAIALILLGGGATVVHKKKKKKDKKTKTEQKPAGAVYKMEVYKEFGNSLSPGYDPRPVYARIVKIVAGGDPVPEPALTAMIEITGDAYLQVSVHRMENGWRCADVAAPQQDAVPEEGVVTFALAGDRGGYVNHLHFKIEAGQVLFGQDNLTLPAHHTQEERLPFVVTGMAEGATIEATITEPENKPTDYYNVRVEWNAELDMHEAVITDLKRDPEKDNGTPGDYLPFTLHIVVTNPGGSRMEGWMPVVRFYMGLAFKVDDVKCFMEEYDPAKHKKLTVGVEHGNKKFVPAETTGYLQLYDYDEELHCVLTINPKPTSFNVKVIDERESREVEGIGLKPDLTGCDNPKGTELVLRCMEGVLDAPSRIDAIITIEAEFDGRSSSCEKQVLLCSQPVRTFQTEAEEIAAAKEDE